MFRITVCAVLLAIASTGVCHAQTSAADSLFQAAQSAYDDGNYDAAELTALRGLRAASSLDEFGQLKFHLLLGFVYVARDQRPTATQEFTKVLAANPAYSLDPVQTSPKIMDVFNEAKQSYMLKIASEPAVFRMPQADVRMAASWRSALLPGWGQFYKKQDTKATAIIAAQVLSLAALIYAQGDMNRRHDDYLRIKQYGSPNVESAYQDYRRAYQTRNVVGYVTLGIYLVNYLDALYAPVLHKPRAR